MVIEDAVKDTNESSRPDAAVAQSIGTEGADLTRGAAA